jgi:glycosyltransferase involved in cell wall biosynthesis
MDTLKNLRVVFPHDAEAIGGPGTFQNLISSCLCDAGAIILPSCSNAKADLVFVVGGTKRLGWIKRHKYKGAKVLHRLDGMKWRHMVEKTPLKYKILFMLQNRMTSYIRSNLADAIVYQSQFVEDWWNLRYGKTKNHSVIIPNGTDLDHFSPLKGEVKAKVPTIVCFEGTVELDNAILHTLKEIQDSLVSEGLIKEVLIWGSASDSERKKVERFGGVRLMGSCHRDAVPEKMNQGDIYLSLELNPPCPNAVVEALASGLPVVGYETGALRELVGTYGGELSPYGADPWKLENPDTKGLVSSLKRILIDLDEKKRKARAVAEENFGKDLLVGRYMEAVKKLLKPLKENS